MAGMPLYKYVFNRLLTAFENLFLRIKVSEYHTGYRAFSKEVLTKLPLLENSDDFVFDNQMLAQCAYFGFKIGEVSCPTKYFAGSVVHQLPPQREVRAGGAGDHDAVCPAEMGAGAIPDFRRRRPQVGTGCG